MEREDREWERREERRRRRRRSQLLVYLAALALAVLVVLGAVAGVRFAMGRLGNRDAGQGQGEGSPEQTQESQAQPESQESPPGEDPSGESSESTDLDWLFSGEESLERPEGEPQESPEPPAEDPLETQIDGLLQSMTLEDKVAGLFIVTPESVTGVSKAVQAGDGTRKALEKYAVGGLIYEEKNMQSREQFAEMLENTRQMSRYPLFLSVEEEGGSFAPVAAAGLMEGALGARQIGESGDPQEAYLAGSGIGAYLRQLGLDLDLAPVADLANVEGSIMGERAYGSDQAAVAPFVQEMVRGLKEQGVEVCLKHFPGIGSATEDFNAGPVSTQRSWEDFHSQELAVFQAGIDGGASMVMVSHIGVPNLAGNQDSTPACMSEAVVTDILRGEMGFQGVIITDALDVPSVSQYYGSGQAAVLSLRAGCDMILRPENFEEAFQGVLEAVQEGTISQERINDSLRRIYRLKYGSGLETWQE